ncbi:hypothetical protein ACFV2C_14930 [[Kitasatospora] papulosa]|uniref:hypothetical protein n=1 Tax=[Kitasatospora] papulosa TaxID=1464011 RepID=UPI0036949E2F
MTSSGEQCIDALSRLTLQAAQPSVSPEWLFVDAVTAVEVHVDRVISAMVTSSGVSRTALGHALLAKLGDEISRSWPARYEWLAAGFEVKVKGEKFEQDFDVAIECRNAIVHGSGQLTKRQQSNFPRFTDLRRRMESVIGVRVFGLELAPSEESAQKCLAISRNFVYGFDHAVSGKVDFDI